MPRKIEKKKRIVSVRQEVRLVENIIGVMKKTDLRLNKFSLKILIKKRKEKVALIFI